MYLPPPLERPSPLPVVDTEYQQWWRGPGIAPWRPIVAVLIGVVAFFTLAVAVTLVGVVVEIVLTGADPATMMDDLVAGTLSPGLVLANSVSIALMLPVCFLLSRLVGQRGGYLSSVVGRFRWGLYWPCLLIAGVCLAVYFGLSIAIDGVDSLGLNVYPHTWWLLIGVMLVTPFQAAAEEYMLRGVLFRTVGSWFASPIAALVVGGVVNSAVFMAIHGANDTWLNVVYFTLGLVLSYLTWRTGGIEAAVAIHIANNMLAFAIVPFQDLDGLFDRSAGVAGPEVLWQIAALVLAAALIVLHARRAHPARAARGEVTAR